MTCHPCSVNPRGVQFIPHTTNVSAKEAKFVYINVHDIHKGDCNDTSTYIDIQRIDMQHTITCQYVDVNIVEAIDIQHTSTYIDIQ